MMSFSSEQLVQVFSRMGRDVGSSLDWEETATKFTELVTPDLCDYCGIWWQDQNKRLTLKKFLVRNAVTLNPVLKFIPQAGPEKVFKEGKLQFIPDISSETEDPILTKDCLQTFKNFSSYICLPLTGSHGVLGAAVFLRKRTREEFNAEEIEVLQQLCDSAAVALDHAQIYEDLKSIQKNYEKSKKRAEKASEAKSEFLANMSHEIRTPLTAIIGFADLILQTEEIGSEVKVWSDRIRYNGMHLLKIVNELLDVSKIESGRLDFEYDNVDLQNFISELQGSLEPQVKTSGNRILFCLESPIPTFIFSDGTRMMQILINIIGNAIKFTDHGVIRVRISYDTVQDVLKFWVQDNGIGLTPEQARKLFKPFSQADITHVKKFGGTGLGLTLSRKLARCLGGDVQLVETQKNQGSLFLITIKHQGAPLREFVQKLDLCRTIDEIRTPPQEETQELSGKRLLLAEDSLDYQRLIAMYFRNTGLQIDYASTGVQALQKAKSRIYDFILMDIQMPEMGGFEVCQRLRSEGYGGQIVALSASDMQEDKIKAQEAGFDDYISKPIDRKRLTNFLKNANPVLSH